MKNSMAKNMAERCEGYFHIRDFEERVAITIYYWVMSTLEAIFWGLGRTTVSSINLYANTENIFLLFCHPTGNTYEFVYYFTHDCNNGNLPKILQKFVEIFNNYDYSPSDKFPYPLFHADYHGKQNNNKKYNGHEYISIYVDMRPNINDNADRDRH